MAAAGDNHGACELISSHMAAAQRQVDHFQHRYPHEDVEPFIMQALYLAAFTFNGQGTFYFWFRTKILGQTARFRRTAKHREIGYLRRGRPAGDGTARQRIPPLHRVAYSERLVDQHFSY
jgi:hypothetical protein